MEEEEENKNELMGTDRDPGDQKQPTSQPRDPKMQLAKVLLPDGVTKEFEVNKNSEGEALFQQVTRDLSIEEREYFSLCFYCKEEGTRHWLYNDKQISKQIKGLPWEFSFEVKFYPTTPTTIVDDHARYYLFLQLRRDLLTGRLPATADTHALLGSFVAQIEFGDAPAQIADAYEKFIVESKLVPDAYATPERFTSIAELHRLLRGQTTGEVELKFLDHAKHLALYGIHIFKATDKDKKPVDIGVGAAGINIYQDEQKVHTFSWQNIIKIGYKRTYFSVKLKAGTIGKDEKTLYYKLPSYVAAKRAWKCAVEHHTFFRLIQPEDKPQKGLLKFGSQRFRYQGRTQFQTKIASQMFDKPSTVERAPSAMSQPITSAEDQKLQTLNLTDSELEQRQFERDKSKKKDKKKSNKKGENETSGETSDSEHDEKREFAVVEYEPESGQPYTTVSTWQETSDLPEQVEVYTDENGRQITRTVKSSQVKHTVQTQSFQNYIVDGDQVPVGVVDVERSREQLTPLGQKASSPSGTGAGALVDQNGGDTTGIVETQTRTMTYEAQGRENAAPPGWAEQGLGEYVSSKSVTQGNRTIETITYKTEKDGVVETHVEHRVTIHSDGDIDHDAELSQAIMEATQMNPDMVVEKIEVRQETTQ